MNRDDFAALIVGYTDRMYRISRSILLNDEDCRDAMQEAALRAWEKRHTLREERYFGTWLIRILINECRNIQRKRRFSVSIDEIAEPPMFWVSDTHCAATWLLDDNAPKVEMPKELRARIDRMLKEAK